MRFSVIAIIMAITFLSFSEEAYAHRMLIRDMEPGIVKVIYDDGTIAKRAQVILYSGQDEELFKGNVSEEGIFNYDKTLQPSKAVADDGMGHRAEYDFSKGEVIETSNTPKAVLGVSMLVFIAAFFNYRNKK
ncbi:hypothetical protein GGQ84_002614 [Desulfitispora alkaliphila]|uniref:hypothetical protein n=1 Tax=Desulfitispora alkaliphila TaxID=622674 RepID=UPI003D24442C